MAMTINHVSICVRNLDEAVARYKKILGAEKAINFGVVEWEGVRAAGIPMGDFVLEFVEPVGDNTFSRFLDKYGEGMHHISFTVDDVEAERERLLADGFELVDRDMRNFNYKGGKINANYIFVHPRNANGVVVEMNTAVFGAQRQKSEGAEMRNTAMKINHLSICARNIDEAVARYKKILGAEKAINFGVVEWEGVKTISIPMGDFMLEFVEPVGDNTFSRFLDKHGEGMHHISFTVSDVEAERARLLAEGFELVDRDLRNFNYKGGKVNANYIFVHPRNANGVVVELNSSVFGAQRQKSEGAE
ncbi:VOC family protein [Chloroflexota bacterium]